MIFDLNFLYQAKRVSLKNLGMRRKTMKMMKVDQTKANPQVSSLAKRLHVVLAASRTARTDCLRSDSGMTTKTLPRDVLDFA